MRPYVLSALLLCLLSTGARAQYQFGIVAGPLYVSTRSVLNVDLPDGVKLDMPTLDGFGYHAGIWYRSDRLHLVNFRAGLEWCYRTFDQDVTELTIGDDLTTQYFYTGERRTHLNYLELPVQGQYYFWKGAHAELGLVFSRLMMGTIFDEGQMRVTSADGTVHYPDRTDETTTDLGDFANFELAMTLGVGYDFKKGICVGVSYIRGLTPIEDGAGVDIKSWFDQIRINVGFDFLHPKGHHVYRWVR